MDFAVIKQLMIDNNFRPKKRFGQNFLIDPNIRNKMVDSTKIGDKDIVIEIGPGFGSMTFLLAETASKVYSVEKDREICALMKPFVSEYDNLEFLECDILEFDISSIMHPGDKCIVFGNIPYYITTPVIEKLIENRKFVKRTYLLTQEEYADRIAAVPGSKTYGSITCFVQYYCDVKKLFKVKRSSFYPRPKVDSCFIRLDMRTTPGVDVKDEEKLFKVIRKSFSQRRKKLLNTLSDGDFLGLSKNEWKILLENCEVDPGARAETLSLNEFGRISDAVTG
jgi:16S rRNA (adenine1518-N6/adenine1519-N6)-dimethyltransferase